MQELIMIMEISKTLFCSSEFLWELKRITLQYTDYLVTRTRKRFVSPVKRLVVGPSGRKTRWRHTTCFLYFFKERLNLV
jgi:hypothetical protein